MVARMGRFGSLIDLCRPRPFIGFWWMRRICGGSQPRTDRGWFLLCHGETRETVGVYRTFWVLLDDPSRILRIEDEKPVLEANPGLTRSVAHQMYLPTSVVFTTGG